MDHSLTDTPLQNANERNTEPDDAMQNNLVPELPPSWGYENIVTAMDVFSRYLLHTRHRIRTSKTNATVITNILTKDAYLRTTLIPDKDTAFMSHVVREVAGVLGNTLKHATTKHVQTIGLLKRPYASINQTLKIETGDRRSLWYNYVDIAVLIYNTSYHTSFGCEPSIDFRSGSPYFMLDLKFSIRPEQAPIFTSHIFHDVVDQTETIYQDVRRNAKQAYIKYKTYYDKKANASKLKEAEYVYVLQPQTDHQGSTIPFREFRWLGPYIVENVLPKNNYLVRKIGTDKTQVLLRMRLRQLTPPQPITVIRITPQEWKPDPEVSLKRNDLYARAWKCE